MSLYADCSFYANIEGELLIRHQPVFCVFLPLVTQMRFEICALNDYLLLTYRIYWTVQKRTLNALTELTEMKH